MRCPNCNVPLRLELEGTDVKSALAVYKDGGVYLPKTGHQVEAPLPGEGITYYFERIGGNPGLSGALLMYSEPYRIGNTGDPILDLAIQVDAFANPEAYGLGGPGAPGVAAGPNPAAPSVQPMPAGGDAIYAGTIPLGGVNSEWKASNPGQVQYADISADGLYSVVCDGAVPVYVGVGFKPGIATFADLKAGGVYGVNTAEVHVKAGQYLCYAHEGNHGNRMRACQR